MVRLHADRATLSHDVNPFGRNLGADMASLRDRATRQKRGTGKYLSRGTRSMLDSAFERSVGEFIAFESRLTFSAGRIMYANDTQQDYRSEKKNFARTKRDSEKEEMRVMRSHKRPSSRITRFSKQLRVQTLGKDE